MRRCLQRCAEHVERAVLRAAEGATGARELASFERMLASMARALEGLLRSEGERPEEIAPAVDALAAALRRIPGGIGKPFVEAWEDREGGRDDCDSLPASPSARVDPRDVGDRVLSWLAAMASGMSAAGFSRQAAPLERELLAAAARGGAWDTRARIVDGVASSLSGGAGAPLDDARFDALVAALRAMMGATAKAEKEKWAFFSAQCELIAGAIDRERDAARRGRLVRAAFLGADSILGALEAKTRAQADGINGVL